MKAKDNFIKIKNNVKDFFTSIGKKRKKSKDKKIIGFSLVEVVVLVMIATVIGVFSGSVLAYGFDWHLFGKNTRTTESRYITEFKKAFDSVVDEYYEDVDKDELIDAAINGMLSTLDDYTSYMTPDENQQFTERLKGEYQGIGIEFVSLQNGDAYTHTITNVFEGTPAYIAGVQKNDVLVSIDDLSISTMTGNEIASYIKSSTVKQISLVVKRNNENVAMVVSKSLVSLPSVTGKTFERNGKKVGYIDISLFADNTYKQFNDTLTSLEAQGINSLIIDVRDNSGGYLHIADNILELFMDKGDILYKTQDKSSITEYKDTTDAKRTYSVSVLINGNSASASEILAAAFKDTYGATLIGTQSFGKGTVQQPTDLPNGGMIKVTTQKWLTPTGEWINKKGIAPTVEVKMGTEYSTSPTEENDTQLQKAIELATN